MVRVPDGPPIHEDPLWVFLNWSIFWDWQSRTPLVSWVRQSSGLSQGNLHQTATLSWQKFRARQRWASPRWPPNQGYINTEALASVFCYTYVMKLIFIYGPPAAGKLTIAEKLSKATGIPLFHNHLTRDIVKDIYEDKLDENYRLVDELRFKVFEYCAKNETDLIFTVVYGGKEDDDIFKEYISVIENSGYEIEFVELTAKSEDLIERVDNESRKKFKKLTDKHVMNKLATDLSVFSMPYVNSLKVNTSELDPDESANFIAKQLNLL